MAKTKLLSPEKIAKLSVPEAIQTLKANLPKSKKKKDCPYTYQPFQREVTLITGIADIEPYKLILPEPPPIEDFVNYGLPPEEQIFQRVVMPKKLQDICKAVRMGVKNGLKYSRNDAFLEVENDKEMSSFIELLWLKRLEGEWQLINGVPIHIPPTYFFYLNFWELNIGLPEFRMDTYHYCTDLWNFCFWDYVVVPSPFCDGEIEFATRQTGKSYRLGVIMYEYSSRSYESNAGMQSKTDSDGALLFEKGVVKPWRKLPFFFQPTFSNSTYPKKALEFTPRAKKGKDDAIESLDNDELMGWIDFGASSLDTYDGATIDRYGDDECGKIPDIDVYARWRTVRPSLRTRGGKSYHTSTVEEMTKRGGKWFKPMWDDSCRITTDRGMQKVKVDENGETLSGLYPWFTPSYCTYSYDEYGVAVVDTITKRQQDYLKKVAPSKHIKYWWLCGKEAIDKLINKETDQASRQDVIRKHPRNIKEAFESSITHCHFKLSIINARLEYFTYGYTPKELEYMKFGRYEWVNGQFLGDVEFVETDFENARVHKIFLPTEDSWKNKRIQAGAGRFKPANTGMFCSSSDCFKYNTKDIKNPSKMSMGAAHTYAFYNPIIDNNREDKLTDDWVEEYLFRPETVEEYCQDMLMSAIYYGCKIYPENNIDAVALYFQKHRCENYLQFGQHLTIKQEVGMVLKEELRSGSGTYTKTIETMFRLGAQYIINNGHRCKFYRTLRDFKEVDSDLNPYDLFVSATICLINAMDITMPRLERMKLVEDNKPAFGMDELRTLLRIA